MGGFDNCVDRSNVYKAILFTLSSVIKLRFGEVNGVKLR